MAQTASEKLDTGDRFPSVILNLVDGRSHVLPERNASGYTVFLVYRGKW